MGGYGSTRWNWTPTRDTTDGLLWLDVRKLAREGWLQPGRASTQTWTRRGQPAGTINLIAGRDAVTLDYRVKGPQDADWRPIRDRIPLAWTPCTYGGERAWFVCPGCQRRRAILYSAAGRFRCRRCHDRAYGSTREDDLDRLYRRRDAIMDKLGGTREGRSYWHFPGKPARMHHRTYARLYIEWLRIEAALDNALETKFRQRVGGDG